MKCVYMLMHDKILHFQQCCTGYVCLTFLPLCQPSNPRIDATISSYFPIFAVSKLRTSFGSFVSRVRFSETGVKERKQVEPEPNKRQYISLNYYESNLFLKFSIMQHCISTFHQNTNTVSDNTLDPPNQHHDTSSRTPLPPFNRTHTRMAIVLSRYFHG